MSQQHVVRRTAETLTFVSPKWWPNNPGHVLVVPTRHFECLYDLPDSLAVPLQVAVREAALALKHAYRCAATSVRQHNEPAGNQDVWHYHVHVFPRHEGDRLYSTEGRWANADDMLEYAQKLRDAYAALELCR